MILEVKHVKKSFGAKKVLDDISFTLNAGEFLGIVGLSGCGKSTLAKIIAKLIPCDSGEIFLCGEDILRTKGNEFYKNMQMIFQNSDDSFNPRRTLGQSIAEPIKNFKINVAVENLLEQVGLPKEYKKRYPREVSGGECQRAAIARAISVSPKLLICDEATSALDVTIQAQIIKLLKCFCVEKNISCLFITHDLAILPELANKIIVLHEGRIIEEGTPEKVIKEPKSLFTRRLMAANFFKEEI